MSQDHDRSGKIDLSFLRRFSFVNTLAYPLALLDFMTTTYGISVQALAFQGLLSIVVSVVLAGIFLWVVLISKDKVAPAIEEKIATPFRGLSSKVQQSKWVEFIADAIAPTTVVLIGVTFAIVDFWTSLEGVSAVIPFKGVLGLVLKSFAVFALVFSTLYLIYLQPKQAE
jgi:hypothetical protein